MRTTARSASTTISGACPRPPASSRLPNRRPYVSASGLRACASASGPSCCATTGRPRQAPPWPPKGPIPGWSPGGTASAPQVLGDEPLGIIHPAAEHRGARGATITCRAAPTQPGDFRGRADAEDKLPAAQLEHTRHTGPLVGRGAPSETPWRAATPGQVASVHPGSTRTRRAWLGADLCPSRGNGGRGRAGRHAFGPPAAPRPCPAGLPVGAYGGYAMRLRLGRARLLGGLVGAQQPGQGR
jgi:hypothetical protein